MFYVLQMTQATILNAKKEEMVDGDLNYAANAPSRAMASTGC
jgi:hypothetical protein